MHFPTFRLLLQELVLQDYELVQENRAVRKG